MLSRGYHTGGPACPLPIPSLDHTHTRRASAVISETPQRGLTHVGMHALGTHWVSTYHVPGAVVGIGVQQGAWWEDPPCPWHSGSRGDRHTTKHTCTPSHRYWGAQGRKQRRERRGCREDGSTQRSRRLPPQGGVIPPERVADRSHGRGHTGKGGLKGAGGPRAWGAFSLRVVGTGGGFWAEEQPAVQAIWGQVAAAGPERQLLRPSECVEPGGGTGGAGKQ